MWVGLSVLFVLLLVFWWRKKTSRPAKFPPGPPRYPIFGNVLQMSNPWSSKPSIFWGVTSFAKKYGDIFSFYLGDQKVVVFTGYEDNKYIFNLEEAHARPHAAPQNKFRPGWHYILEHDEEINTGRHPGVIMSNGRYWREQRRFLLRNLRDLGFGKSSMESLLHEEVKKLIDYLRPKANNEPCNLNNMFNISILNALWTILVGEKMSLNDARGKTMLSNLDTFLRESEGPTSAVASLVPFPDILLLPGIKHVLGLSLIENLFSGLVDMVRPIIQDHKNTFDEHNPRDLIDIYLSEIKRTQDKSSSFYDAKGESALVNDLIDMFLAGTETTSSALLWSILFMLHFPECQEKLLDEINTCVGPNRLPSLDNRPQMHYTNAFLLESLRVAAFVPMSVFQWSIEDIAYKGYVIPKNTLLISSLYHIMHNPEFFPQPQAFKPERFLSADGKFVNDEKVVAFGIGKRYCLGKSLADKEYFLFLTALVQAFQFRQVPGSILPKFGVEDVPVLGLTRQVPLYEVLIQPRVM